MANQIQKPSEVKVCKECGLKLEESNGRLKCPYCDADIDNFQK